MCSLSSLLKRAAWRGVSRWVCRFSIVLHLTLQEVQGASRQCKLCLWDSSAWWTLSSPFGYAVYKWNCDVRATTNERDDQLERWPMGKMVNVSDDQSSWPIRAMTNERDDQWKQWPMRAMTNQRYPLRTTTNELMTNERPDQWEWWPMKEITDESDNQWTHNKRVKTNERNELIGKTSYLVIHFCWSIFCWRCPLDQWWAPGSEWCSLGQWGAVGRNVPESDTH